MIYLKIRGVPWKCLIAIIIFISLHKLWFYLMNRNTLQMPLEYYETFKGLYSKEHELAKRRMDNTIWELYYYLSDQLIKNENSTEFQTFGKYALDHTISLILQSTNFGKIVDNAAEWHRAKLKQVSNLIFERIHRLQHPNDCTKAKFLICRLDFDCGLGCVIHRMAYCLRLAAASDRTMIMYKDNGEWNYSNKSTEMVFQPLGSCNYNNVVQQIDETIVNWTSTKQIDRLTVVYGKIKNSQTDKMAMSFPQQLADELLTHHPDPAKFFDAHFSWYVSRINKFVQKMVDDVVEEIKLNDGPIVAMHIRRTDKIELEAVARSVDDYFKWADLWYHLQERQSPRNKKLKRRVYIATDDLNVIKEAKKKYPHYTIYSNAKATEKAGLDSRYTVESLYSLITDLQILSKCNFVICTFSSNVCRYVYEKKQVDKGNADREVHSLDTAFRTHYAQYGRDFVAVEDHRANNDKELNFKKGDLIGVAKCEGNLMNGFSTGFIRPAAFKQINNTYLYGQIKDRWYQRRFVPFEGIYPSYKAKEVWKIVDFPMFQH